MDKNQEWFFHFEWKNWWSFHGFSKYLRQFWFNCPPYPWHFHVRIPEVFGIWGEGAVAHSILLEVSPFLSPWQPGIQESPQNLFEMVRPKQDGEKGTKCGNSIPGLWWIQRFSELGSELEMIGLESHGLCLDWYPGREFGIAGVEFHHCFSSLEFMESWNGLGWVRP